MSNSLTSDGWPRKPRNARTKDLGAWFYIGETGIDICIETARPVGTAHLSWRQIEAALRARARAEGVSK